MKKKKMELRGKLNKHKNFELHQKNTTSSNTKLLILRLVTGRELPVR
jgi:hypothetical protein